MRRLIFLTLLLIIFSPFSSWAWYIKYYDVEIKVEPSSELKIVEKLVVDFEDENKHGIYRDIPLDFYDPSGKKHRIEIKDILVTNQNLNSYQTKISKHKNTLRIKIGDPNKLVNGTQFYIISYKVKYALYNLGPIDELYWNAIGTGWNVPIKNVTAKVILPFEDSSIQFTCYTGAFGRIDKNCKIKKEKQAILFTLTQPLSAHEGMTIAVGWKAGLIPIPEGPPWWKNPWIYTFLYIILFLSFMIWLWWTKGRDIGGKGAIQTQYFPPENLTPLEAGTLIDEKVDGRDIVAEIIDLARRGYLKIIEIEEPKFLFGKKINYILEQTKKFDTVIQNNPFDLQILSGIFEDKSRVKLSELNKKFYRFIPLIKKHVFSSLTSKGFFFKNPLNVRNKYTWLGAIVFIFTIWIMIGSQFLYSTLPFPILLSGLVTAFGLLIFGRFMPRKTSKGTEMLEYLKGYEEFITKVERDVIEKLFSPEKIPEVFEVTLPFAIVFGEGDKWAEAFESLFTKPPRWYEGTDSFSTVYFAHSLNNFTSQASQIFTTSPRSSSSGSGGGGFSGGGAGGGGGGSW
ncbi:DUF2207 domain-containing protein [Thermodesulfobacterium sp. TA1]|uniref:DUF2207 domain-containing protein n=1 Tax=Thermodesulfobacterium sp. TA1 TaxID=2234087 RepID=UPI00123287B0|nr:DUF2207 domain-containing protein [Thermodesulfobacterium sp. TA1]QER41591.1 DUF2207 domain-containing protein [Thermodesulfobacterium sp. TA1]